MTKERWKKIWDYTLILIIFAITGSTAAILPKYLLPPLGVTNGTVSYWVTYFLVITPIYQVLLLGYAFLFGKFQYFYEKQRKMGRWILRKLGLRKEK